MNTYDPHKCNKSCNGLYYNCPQYSPYSEQIKKCDIAYLRKELNGNITEFSELEKILKGETNEFI